MLLAGKEVVENLLALGIPDPLENNLFGCLRADAPKLDGLEGLLDVVLEIGEAVGERVKTSRSGLSGIEPLLPLLAPLRIVGATGAPTRPLALVPNP